MELFRIHAYAVSPARTDEDEVLPNGGPARIDAALSEALADAHRRAQLDEQTLVVFQVDATTRTSAMRDLILGFAFKPDRQSVTDSQDIAQRLSDSMDQRSAPCLLILTAEREGGQRRVTLWTFPRDIAFQFRGGSRGPSLRSLNDVFSRTSRLRKAVLFEGQHRRTDFLEGRALDLQAHAITREVADFWIRRFLNCNLSIASDTGTRMLANTIRQAYDAAETPEERDQLYAGLIAVRHSPQTRWSMRQFADQYLHDPIKEKFLRSAPNVDSLGSSFDFDSEIFERTINFRVFELNTGVRVSAPFDQVGQSVQVDGRRLQCEGEIVEEKVRARRA